MSAASRSLAPSMIVTPIPLVARANRDPVRVAMLREMLALPHMAPLAAYTRDLRAKLGDGWVVPEFDPLGGGTDADILFLFEKPGPEATAFISMCNDDPTAAHGLDFMQQAGIDYARTAIWNVMPAWNGKIRFKAAERRWGLLQLDALLSLLPGIKVVVLVGRQAEKARIHLESAGYQVVASAHPSMRVRNGFPDRWAAIPDQWRLAREFADVGRSRREK